MPQLPDADSDGNSLTPPAPQTDTERLIYLLEWARLRGFRLGPNLQIGDLVVQVTDLRQTEGRGGGGELDEGPWAAHGHKED